MFWVQIHRTELQKMHSIVNCSSEHYVKTNIYFKLYLSVFPQSFFFGSFFSFSFALWQKTNNNNSWIVRCWRCICVQSDCTISIFIGWPLSTPHRFCISCLCAWFELFDFFTFFFFLSRIEKKEVCWVCV